MSRAPESKGAAGAAAGGGEARPGDAANPPDGPAGEPPLTADSPPAKVDRPLPEPALDADYKSAIIERLFLKRLVDGALPPDRRVVTRDEVGEEIQEYNKTLLEAHQKANAEYAKAIAEHKAEKERRKLLSRAERKALDELKKPRRPRELLSPGNTANFIKDFQRRQGRAAARLREFTEAVRHTVRQVTGDGQCFEFVPVTDTPGTEPTPLYPKVSFSELAKRINETFSYGLPPTLEGEKADPALGIKLIPVESVSMSPSARQAGKSDEPWLGRVIAQLRVVETYLAVHSTRRKLVRHVEHLRGNVKLRRAEIDELYRVSESNGGTRSELLVCCELKRRGEDLTESQLLQQLREGAALAEQMFPPGSKDGAPGGVDTHHVMLMGVKVLGDSMIHVMEFDTLPISQAAKATSVTLMESVVFLITPAVPGVGNAGFRLRRT